MRFASIGSGSAGNAMLVEAGNTLVMLDCGFSLKETVMRMQRLNLSPVQLSGIVVTHEHDDHASGVFKLAAKFNIPVWLTYGTYKMSSRYIPNDHQLTVNIVNSHETFNIGDIQVQPYPVPHDAREPMQCIFSDGNHKLGVLTDVGRSTPHIERVLSACQALVLECNHDESMLHQGPYHQALKKRVGGDLGHLENNAAAAILARLDNSQLQHIISAHLSAKNNTPLLAKTALSQALNCTLEWIGLADQQLGFDWRVIQ